MAWNVSIDNISDVDTLWDWDALIQNGTIIFLGSGLMAQEVLTLPGLASQESPFENSFIGQEMLSGELS